MSINIEIFINRVSIKLYTFSNTNTLADVRQKLGIGNSEDYIFLFNDKEIKFSEEKQYTIQNFESSKKIYIKKKIATNPFLSNIKNQKINQNNNKNIGKKEINQSNKINDIKPANKPKEKIEDKNIKDKIKKEDKKENKKNEEKKDNKKEIDEKKRNLKEVKKEEQKKEEKLEEKKETKIEEPEIKEKKKEQPKEEKKEEIKEEIKEKKTEEQAKKINKEKEKIKKEIKEEEIKTIKKDNIKDKISETDDDDETFDVSENIYETENIDYDIIDNKIEQNIGIEQLTIEDNNKVKIRKELLRTVNSFIACLGPPGSGKSTFCSNYYKKLYKVKNDYFESSDEDQSFTKGIWIVSDAERRKIPIMIKKDLLDVEGFQADAAKCWKYVMIIAFLSTELLILNRDARYDSVKKVIKIIENSLKKMKEKKMPRILKTIYIQTIHKKPKKTVQEMLDGFNYDKNAFDTIKFEYVYLPSLSVSELEDYPKLIDNPTYKKYLDELLNKITKTKNYNSVASLIDYIDTFNETVNGNSGFNSQTILQDLELDFNGIYNRHENKLKNDLKEFLILKK